MRFELLRRTYNLAEGEASRWVSLETVQKDFPGGTAVLHPLIDELIEPGLLKIPESWSIQILDPGVQEFEEIGDALDRLGYSDTIDEETYRELLPALWKLRLSPEVETRSEVRPSMERFPTPADVGWSKIDITFVDPDRVRIESKDVRKTYNFTQMGMVDRRNAVPNVKWELLRDLAETYGHLGWGDSGATPKAQKRKERLSTVLKAFFGLAGEPIPWDDDEKCWRTAFRLSPRM